jgi:hypothetical protein
MSTEQPPNWHVTVCVHQPITPTQADGLFDVLADAAHDWEPAGVDVDVSGGPCYCRQSPAAVARVLDAARQWRDYWDADPFKMALAAAKAGLAAAVDALDPDADPATERDFDQAAAAGVPVTVVGTPPWRVHDSPPPTHGTPAADPPDGWDQEGWEGVSRAGAIRQAEAKHELSQQLFAALESVKQQLSTACADRDRYLALVRTGDRELAGVRAELATARRDAAADALLMVRQRFEESTTDGNIVTGWWLMWLQAWAAEVRTGQRTIIPQSATTTDDLPEWERDMLNRQEET